MAPLLQRRANPGGGLGVLTPELEKEMRWLVENLRQTKPRTLEALDGRPAVKALSDASWEPTREQAGIGGVILGQDGRPALYFSAWVPTRIWNMLARTSVHIIAQLEHLAVLVLPAFG